MSNQKEFARTEKWFGSNETMVQLNQKVFTRTKMFTVEVDSTTLDDFDTPPSADRTYTAQGLAEIFGGISDRALSKRIRDRILAEYQWLSESSLKDGQRWNSTALMLLQEHAEIMLSEIPEMSPSGGFTGKMISNPNRQGLKAYREHVAAKRPAISPEVLGSESQTPVSGAIIPSVQGALDDVQAVHEEMELTLGGLFHPAEMAESTEAQWQAVGAQIVAPKCNAMLSGAAKVLNETAQKLQSMGAG